MTSKIITSALIIGTTLLFTLYIKTYNEPYNTEIIINYTPKAVKKIEDETIDLRKRNFQYFDKVSSWPNSQVPWYVVGGTVYPNKSKGPAKLLPEQADGDRILEQLMYVPENYNFSAELPPKLILSYESFPEWDGFFGRSMIGYNFEGCPVSKCFLTDDKTKAVLADAILFREIHHRPKHQRPKNQIWIKLFLESPQNTARVLYPEGFNWTATYRRDSDISIPYGKWVYYNDEVRQKPQTQNFAANKTKKVAWFVSNCGARNNRLTYAKKLARHIQVDIYGACGTMKCPRTSRNCFESLSEDYKFYLAFENSNCRDYITEKLFENGFGYNILPVVLGIKSENYRKITPEGSFIHVDDFASPAELAAFLYKLNEDDDLYNSYFRWKGTGEFINHHFWCRLCAMLHADLPPKHYENINDWWQQKGICSLSRVVRPRGILVCY